MTRKSGSGRGTQDSTLAMDSLDSGAHLLVHEPRAGSYDVRPVRKRTCLSGKLVFGDGAFAPSDAFTLDCTIRNISKGGAKIVLARRQPLPLRLYLIVVKHCVAHQAKVAWLDFPARGLEFLQTYPLSDALPEDLLYLRKLWGALYVRSGEPRD